jgi:hypothetical protein
MALSARAVTADRETKISCHTFRATGMTTNLENGGTLEHAQQIAAHESPRTTKLYDRLRMGRATLLVARGMDRMGKLEVCMLHQFLTASRDKIIARTRTKVASRPAPRATEAELENGIPLFLTQLVGMLQTPLESGTTAIGTSAAKHGDELLRIGVQCGTGRPQLRGALPSDYRDCRRG